MSYYAFGGDSFYPEGGWGDFLGVFDTVEEAKARIEAGYDLEHTKGVSHYAYGWGHVVLRDDRTVVWSWRHDDGSGRPNDPGEWSEGYDRW